MKEEGEEVIVYIVLYLLRNRDDGYFQGCCSGCFVDRYVD
jgi:hypothetical protein